MKSPPPRAFSVPDVHPRLRKHPPRCTLDCGFKTSESPALRGFVAERAPIRGTSLYLVIFSNGLRHSKNLPVKFGFSSKSVPATIAQKLPPQRWPQPLFITFFNFSHKWPMFAFTGERGYTLAFRRKIAHKRLHVETGAFRMGVVSLPSDCFTRFGNPAWPGGRTANFAAFGPWSGVLSKNAESLRNSDALMRVAVSRRRGPAGLRSYAAVVHSGRLAGMKRLDQAFRQSYYHTQRPSGQPFGACAGAALGGKMRAITLDFKESHHGRT